MPILVPFIANYFTSDDVVGIVLFTRGRSFSIRSKVD